MQVLYLGLSNNIRGVAEAFIANGDKVHMVQPGEKISRLGEAFQILKRRSIDAIVIAETTGSKSGAVQAKLVIEILRGKAIEQPILVLRNHLNKVNGVALIRAGSNGFLPLQYHRQNDYFFTNPHFLTLNTIGLVEASKEIALRKLKSAKASLCQTTGEVSIAGRTLQLPNLEYRLMRLLLNNHGGICPSSFIQRELYGFENTQNENGVRRTVFRLNERIRSAFADLPLPKNFRLVEMVGRQGWRIRPANIELLARLNETDAQELAFPAEEANPKRTVELADLSFVSANRILRYYGFSFDPGMQEARFRNYSFSLTTTLKKVLRGLMLKGGEIVSRDALYAACDLKGSGVSPDVISSYVGQLRKQLGEQLTEQGYDAGDKVIDTMGKRGWRLSEEVWQQLSEQTEPKKIVSIGKSTNRPRGVASKVLRASAAMG